MSFVDALRPFAVRGDASSLHSHLHFEGRVAALVELGDVDAQTVSGAISTGTHDTGRPPGVGRQDDLPRGSRGRLRRRDRAA